MSAQVLHEEDHGDLMRFFLKQEDPLSKLALSSFYRDYYLKGDIRDGFIIGVYEEQKLVQAFLTVARKKQLLVRTVVGEFGRNCAEAVILLRCRSEDLGLEPFIKLLVTAEDEVALSVHLGVQSNIPPTYEIVDTRLIPANRREAEKAIWLDILNRTVYTRDMVVITLRYN